jgi:hypothetical protein
MDLDDLLDDIEVEEESDGAVETISDANAREILDLLDMTGADSTAVEKLTTIFKTCDRLPRKCNLKFASSYEFRAGDAGSNSTSKSDGLHKLLQDAVRDSCTKCGFDSNRSAALLRMVNSFETVSGKVLQAAYNKQVLLDSKKAVAESQNFDKKNFPALAKFYGIE